MMLFEKVAAVSAQSAQAADHDAYDEWARLCDRADALLEAQPDEAALLLDGLLYRIAHEWERMQQAQQAAPLQAGAPEDLLARIECAAPAVSWRLRLALRAPDARARLVACRSLIEALDAWELNIAQKGRA